MQIDLETIKTAGSYLGAIGFGGFFGIFLNNYFQSRENRKKLLFEARVKAYSGLVSRFFNLFNELDINRLEESLRFVKINELLSEAYLLGSHEFVEKIGKFKPNLLAFHKELDEHMKDKVRDETLIKSLHKSLIEEIGLIYNQMRLDLFIEKVEVEELQTSANSDDSFRLRGLSAEEIKKRHIRSVQEAVEVKKINRELAEESQQTDIKSEEQVNIDESSYAAVLPKIEEKALSKISSSLGVKIEPQVSFHGLPIMFDGAVVNNKKKEIRFIEIKMFPSLPVNRHGKVMAYALVSSVQRTIEPIIRILSDRIRTGFFEPSWKYTLTIVIVLNAKNDFIKLRRRIEELKQEFNQLAESSNLTINFVFYNLKNMDLELGE